MIKQTRIVAMAALGISMLWATDASAAMVSYRIGDGGFQHYDVTIKTGATTVTHANAYVGAIALTEVGTTGFPDSYNSVCTDINGTLSFGGVYGYDAETWGAGSPPHHGLAPKWGADEGAGSDWYVAIRVAAAVYYQHRDVLDGSDTMLKAALQLAVWEALYDTVATSTGGNGTGAYSFGSGRLQASNDNGAYGDDLAIDTALLWLNNSGLVGGPILAPSTEKGTLLYPNPDSSPAPQGLLMRDTDVPTNPVPEPSTVLAGLFLGIPFAFSTMRVMLKKRTA